MSKKFIDILRDRKIKSPEFRRVADSLADILAQDIFDYLGLSKTKAKKSNVVLVPVLRSGVALLSSFLKFSSSAKIAFVGIRRDEKTALPIEYYKNFPKIKSTDQIIILDPMLATGGTAVATVKMLKKNKVTLKQIIFVSLIVAPEGINFFKKHFPEVKLIVKFVDKKLDKKKFIVPGIGDFGDRYFDTK